jgi:Fic family protein
VKTLSKEHEQQSAAAEGSEKQTKKKKKPKVAVKKRPIQLLSIRWHRAILDEGTLLVPKYFPRFLSARW